jgi:hypothetical protein
MDTNQILERDRISASFAALSIWWMRTSSRTRDRAVEEAERTGSQPHRARLGWSTRLAVNGPFRHPVSAPTVSRLLRENGFSLQGNA